MFPASLQVSMCGQVWSWWKTSNLLERLAASLACHSMAKCNLPVDSCNGNSSFMTVFLFALNSNQRLLRHKLSPCSLAVAHHSQNRGVVHLRGTDTYCLKLSKLSIPRRTKNEGQIHRTQHIWVNLLRHFKWICVPQQAHWEIENGNWELTPQLSSICWERDCIVHILLVKESVKIPFHLQQIKLLLKIKRGPKMFYTPASTKEAVWCSDQEQFAMPACTASVR